MEVIDFSVLELLDNHELQVACKYADIEVMLKPIKDHPEYYKKYTKMFGGGKLDKKSQLVKTFLPKVTFDLYQKGDEAYRAVVALILKNYQDKFLEEIAEGLETPISISQIKEYGIDEVVELYTKLIEISVTEVSIELYFVLLKLQGITFDDSDEKTISEKVEQIKEFEEEKRKLIEDKDDAIKKAENQLTLKFEQEKGQLVKEKRETDKSLFEARKRISELEENLQKVTERMNQEHDSLVEQWKNAYETEYSVGKVEIEQRLQNQYEEKSRDLATELQNKKEEEKLKLENAFEEKEEQLRRTLKKSESELENIIIGLNEEIRIVNQKKDAIIAEINLLTEKRGKLQDTISQLEEYENNYFAKFDQHILEKKIDSILAQKNGIMNFANIPKENESSVVSREQDNNLIVTLAEPILGSMGNSEPTSELEDFFNDLSDNLSLFFHESSELAAIILGAILNNKGIIVSDSVGLITANSLSALVDGSSPLIIDLSKEKHDLNTIINTIKGADTKTVYLPGILDDYDEGTFSIINRECYEKFLFCGIASLDSSSLLSKNIFNYAIALDNEKYMHFPIEEVLWVGKHNIRLLEVPFDKSTCQNYYNKFFRTLYSNKILSQKKALDFSCILQTYFSLINNEKLGGVLQETIGFACDFGKVSSDDLDNILHKSGFSYLAD